VISGTQTLVISGTRPSWFQEPEPALSLCAGNEIGAPNLSNIESFGFLLTDYAHFHPMWKSPKTTRVTIALFNQAGGVSGTTVALDPVRRWPHQRWRFIVIGADRKGKNENCCLDWSKLRVKESLTRLFRGIGAAPSAPRREALDIACAVDQVFTDGLSRFAVWTRSARLATDVALTPCQSSPFDEGAPVGVGELMEKALSFGNQLRPSFVLIRRGPCALIAPERAEAFAERDPATPRGRVGRRAAIANVACSSQFTWKPGRDGHAARADDRARCRNHERRTVTARDRKSVFAVRPRDPEVRSRRAKGCAVESTAKVHRFTPRPPIDVTPELRGRIKVMMFQREQIAREFPQTQGDGADGQSHRG
jgi:hypothetical protein